MDVISSYVEAEKKGWGKTQAEAENEARKNAKSYIDEVKQSDPSRWHEKVDVSVKRYSIYRFCATAFIKMWRDD